MSDYSEPALIVTFVRHGESKDNLRPVWAGWADAPLSELGEEQARALGKSLGEVPFVHIYASDLKRATMTAQALQAGQAAESKPPLTRTTLIREQHFGIAEGRPFSLKMIPGKSLEEHFAMEVFPVLPGPTARFPEGESAVDLGERATIAINELVIPHVWKAAKEGERGVHLAVVSHGLCISQLVPALLKHGSYSGSEDYSGLKNTAWTRVEVTLQSGRKGEPMTISDSELPPLDIKVTQKNIHDHLKTVRQPAESASTDSRQEDVKAFFGGGGTASKGDKPLVKEHAHSNVGDQPGKVAGQGHL